MLTHWHQSDSDSEIENEVDELEVIKKRKDREFRRMNEQNARTLRRFDADIDHKSALIEQLLKSKQQAETLRYGRITSVARQ